MTSESQPDAGIQPGQAPRQALSRDRVMRAALDLADTRGLEALTMRTLAQALGVEAMSLYHYVSKKDEILAGIVELVEEQIELPAPADGWKAGLRRTAMSSYVTLRRHPWAPNLIQSTTMASPARLRWMNAVLGTLRTAGFSPDLTDHAYHALESHITGFALWQTSLNLPAADDLEAIARSFMATLPTDELPWMVEHIEQHLLPTSPTGRTEFEFGLDLLLDGLERLLPAPSPA